MRSVLNTFLFLGLFALLTACKNESPAQKNTPSVSAAIATANAGFYKHLRGTVGTFPVTMDVVKTVISLDDAGLTHFSGYYSYDKYRKPLPIYGAIDSTGVVQLEESGRDGATGVFKGKFNADGSFSGIWEDTLKKLKYDFMLRETLDDGAIAFEMFPFEDSVKLFQNVANSPQGAFSMAVLLPAKNTEGSLFDFLRTQIVKKLKGDSLTGNYVNLQISDVQKTARDSFFKLYKTELSEEKPDTTEQAMLNYAQSTSMDVVSNTDGLLTLAFRDYNYMGGAHGNYGTHLITYDLKNKKAVTLNDVFKPNYKSVLNAAVIRSARRYFGLKPKDVLEDHLFSTGIEHNDNFMVNRKGITFNYVPYEIASYAEGEIQLFVPFEELKAILK